MSVDGDLLGLLLEVYSLIFVQHMLGCIALEVKFLFAQRKVY